MSSATPPNPFFSGIHFNPSFFSSINDYLTIAIANSKYPGIWIGLDCVDWVGLVLKWAPHFIHQFLI